MFDISDSSSCSQTQCLWHILALLYPHPLPRASKWDTSAESKNHRPSPQTERFVCGAVIGKQIDGENIKSIAFTWLLFKMLILAKQMLLISFFFSLSSSLCVKKSVKKEALGFSLFKTKYNNNSFNGKYWLWASIKEEACHKCGFMEMNGAFLIPFIVYLPEMRRVGGRRRQGLQPLLHICCMATHVNSEFSFSFLWRHYGWNPPITWNVSLKDVGTAASDFFSQPCLDSSGPIPSISLCCSRTSAKSRRESKTGFSCGSRPAILPSLLDKR